MNVVTSNPRVRDGLRSRAGWAFGWAFGRTLRRATRQDVIRRIKLASPALVSVSLKDAAT